MKQYQHNTGNIIGRGGGELFFQSWTVTKPSGVLVISHGMGEHSGRYGNLLQWLEGKGISVYALDHRGHGRSAGRKGHVNSFMEYVEDLKIFISIARSETEEIPVFLLGHSMGGAIALKYALTYPESLDGLILSAPALIPAMDVPAWKSALGRFFSKYLPELTMSNGLNADDISHDRFVIEAYRSDPLVHDRVTARFYTEFTATMEECLKRATELTLPLLVFHGTADRMVDFRSSIVTAEKASSPDKELRLFEGLYHETMNEVDHERDKVLETVGRWLLRHLKSLKGGGSIVQKKSTAKKGSPKAGGKKPGASGKPKTRK